MLCTADVRVLDEMRLTEVQVGCVGQQPKLRRYGAAVAAAREVDLGGPGGKIRW